MNHWVYFAGEFFTFSLNFSISTQAKSFTSSGFILTSGVLSQKVEKQSTTSCYISSEPTFALYSILSIKRSSKFLRPSSSNIRLLEQSSELSPQFGCEQQELAQSSGEWYLLDALCWMSSFPPQKTNIEIALCFKPLLWTSSFSTGSSVPLFQAGIKLSCIFLRNDT